MTCIVQILLANNAIDGHHFNVKPSIASFSKPIVCVYFVCFGNKGRIDCSGYQWTTLSIGVHFLVSAFHNLISYNIQRRFLNTGISVDVQCIGEIILILLGVFYRTGLENEEFCLTGNA